MLCLMTLAFPAIAWADRDWSQQAARMCVDPDWEPLEKITPDGQFVGIAADLLRVIFQRAKLEFVVIPTVDWNESLVKSQAGECDILALLNKTEQRSQWLNFTRPYLVNPNVLITRHEHHYVDNLNDLASTDSSIVLPIGTSVYEFLKRDYPNINLIPVDTEREAFDLVDRGLADATLRSLLVAAYTIRNEGWFNLKIAGEIGDYKNLLRIGVLHQHPLLLEQLDQAIATLTVEDINQAINRHVPISVSYRYDWIMIVKIIMISMIIICALLFAGLLQYRSHRRLLALKSQLETTLVEKDNIELRLRESERFYRSLVDTAHEGIGVIQNQRFVYANHYLAQIVGLNIEQLLKLSSFLDLVSPEYQPAVLKAHHQRLSKEATPPQRYQAQLIHANGHIIDIEVSGVMVDWYGEPASLNFISDITDRKQAEREITHLANHDTLTGLANRRLLMERMEQLILQAKRNPIQFAVIFIDLDKFKPVNDYWGHQVGDELLQAISQRLTESIRASDTLARIGGDEFVILLPHLPSEHINDVVRKIEHTFQIPFVLKEKTLSIHASLGVANFPNDGDTASELLNRADREMYRNKQVNV